jgi:hypothetical protein
VLGRVHLDEALEGNFFRQVGDGDRGLGGEQLVVLLNVRDVVELGDRPERAVFAVGAVVDRVVTPQALEEAPLRVVLVELTLADVDLVERDPRRILLDHAQGFDGIQHDGPSSIAVVHARRAPGGPQASVHGVHPNRQRAVTTDHV